MTTSRSAKSFWAIVAYLQALWIYSAWLLTKLREQINRLSGLTCVIVVVVLGDLLLLTTGYSFSPQEDRLATQRSRTMGVLSKLIIEKKELDSDEAKIILRGSWHYVILPEIRKFFPKLNDDALQCKFADCLILKTPNVLDLKPKVGKLKPDFLREGLAKDILRYAQEPTQWKNASWYHTNLLIMFVVTRDSFEGDPTPTLHALFHPTAIWVEGPKPS